MHTLLLPRIPQSAADCLSADAIWTVTLFDIDVCRQQAWPVQDSQPTNLGFLLLLR